MGIFSWAIGYSPLLVFDYGPSLYTNPGGEDSVRAYEDRHRWEGRLRIIRRTSLAADEEPSSPFVVSADRAAGEGARRRPYGVGPRRQARSPLEAARDPPWICA